MAKLQRPYLTRLRNFNNEKEVSAKALENEFDNIVKYVNKLINDIIVPEHKTVKELVDSINNSVRLNSIAYNEKVYSGLNANYITVDIGVSTAVATDLFLANVYEGDTLAFLWVPRKTGFVAVSSDLQFLIKDSDETFFTGDQIGIAEAGPYESTIFKTYIQNDVLYYRFEAGTTPFDTGEGKIIALILRKPDIKTLTVAPINLGAIL